jgi:hypothetical protein
MSEERSASPIQSFEQLREQVLALGERLLPAAIADERNGLLGYAVVSEEALKVAAERNTVGWGTAGMLTSIAMIWARPGPTTGAQPWPATWPAQRRS